MTAPPLRVVIVDDEPLGRQRVADLLSGEQSIQIAGVAENGQTAIELIGRVHPDLVFLDVQMPGLSGLDVARRLGDDMPPTIFVTAYDQHALKAFDLAAIDYLVKPFDDERFEQALKRARRVTDLEETRRVHERMVELLRTTLPPRPVEETPRDDSAREPARTESGLERIAVESRGKVKLVPVSEIDYIAASGPYAEIVTGSRRHLVREPMQDLEERLDPARFVRIHRSYIVPIDRIDTLLRGAGGDYEVQLKDGTRLRVSRSRREMLEQKLGMRG